MFSATSSGEKLQETDVPHEHKEERGAQQQQSKQRCQQQRATAAEWVEVRNYKFIPPPLPRRKKCVYFSTSASRVLNNNADNTYRHVSHLSYDISRHTKKSPASSKIFIGRYAETPGSKTVPHPIPVLHSRDFIYLSIFS